MASPNRAARPHSDCSTSSLRYLYSFNTNVDPYTFPMPRQCHVKHSTCRVAPTPRQCQPRQTCASMHAFTLIVAHRETSVSKIGRSAERGMEQQRAIKDGLS
ncbi:hypothetical protein CY34DRAFT_802602 [Suillus luteus UH-Slu-Lm8-n1]|uniref:Uncharacterized protein n=1 Tax=Suillus luteus UH-Slu-Lm8-n1 TaxID=930992 RepID=A0A0D0B3L2_9AGAM|nr:hypothetical protein CY34DRAFT_802602 [Suillus luteus UH-Slu-Lm8-n1]